MHTIPLADLKAQYTSIKSEIHEAVVHVLENAACNAITKEVDEFEEAFATFCHARFAVGVNSGTVALYLALLACGIRHGDDVITVSLASATIVEAIAMCGARPVFVDIDPATYTIDLDLLEAALTPRTKVILAVHLYGQPADMHPLQDIARHHQLRVIEEASHAPGASYHGQRVGTLGDVACFGFDANKNLGACGQAGCVVTNDANLAQRIQRLRDFGHCQQDDTPVGEPVFHMDTIQAAILRVKLRYLEQWNAHRQQIAAVYNTATFPYNTVVLPFVPDWAIPSWHLYVIEIPQRDRVKAYFQQAGIETAIHYPKPLHLQPNCRRIGFTRGDLPQTEKTVRYILSLPIYPEMTLQQAEKVITTLKECVSLLKTWKI